MSADDFLSLSVILALVSQQVLELSSVDGASVALGPICRLSSPWTLRRGKIKIDVVHFELIYH